MVRRSAVRASCARMFAVGAPMLAGCALLLGLAGCAASDAAAPSAAPADSAPAAALGDADSRAIGQLAGIAARDAELDGEARRAECWLPSANPLAEGGFRVICRVHYEQRGEDRYRDMICIGDLARDPVADYCYPWVYYTEMPKFEDRPAYGAPVD